MLVGHSFSGTIITEVGGTPDVLALVYIAGREPEAGDDYAALAKRFPIPPATAGIVFDCDEGSQCSPGTRPRLYAVEPFQRA